MSSRSFKSVETPQKTKDFSLVYSVALHILLGSGLYYASKPHLPNAPTGIEVNVVSADMLQQLQQNAEETANNLPALSTKETTNVQKNTPAETSLQNSELPAENTDFTDTTDYAQDIAFEQESTISSAVSAMAGFAKSVVSRATGSPSEEYTPDTDNSLNELDEQLTKQAEEEKQDSTFKPFSEQKVKADLTKPVKKEKQEPEKPVTNEFIEAQQKKKAKEKQERERLREKQRNEENRRLQEITDAAKAQQLADMQQVKKLKQSESAEAKRREKRRQEAIEAMQKNRERLQEKQKQDTSMQNKSVSFANASTRAASTPKSTSTQVTAGVSSKSSAQVNSIKNRFVSIIANKIYRNLNEKTTKSGTATVNLRLGSTGHILGATITRSSGDPHLDELFLAAVYDSGPLPVPSDEYIFSKYFQNLPIELSIG